MPPVCIRASTPADRAHLRGAIVELQEHERRLYAGRRGGEEIADAYLDWMLAKASGGGAVFVAEVDGAFAGFAAGWIEEENAIEDTPDSNRYGLVSDLCVLAPYRGRRIASRLIEALETQLSRAGVTRIRIGALAANKTARGAYERAGFALYEVVYEKLVQQAKR